MAIPSNLAIWVVDQLRTHGDVRRSTIGITTVSAPPSYDAQVGLSPSRVKVTQVGSGSPAEKAGLQVDDVIVAFDKTKIQDSGLLEELVQLQEVGSKHRLEFLRQGKTIVVDVVTEQAATPAEVASDDLTHDANPTEIVYSGAVVGTRDGTSSGASNSTVYFAGFLPWNGLLRRLGDLRIRLLPRFLPPASPGLVVASPCSWSRGG